MHPIVEKERELSAYLEEWIMARYGEWNKDLGFSYYDMCLSDLAMENFVITMSPLSDSAQWAIVEALRDKYAPKAEIRRSNLVGKLAR